MRKIELPERDGWRAKATELGFTFADMHGEPYWEESSAYEFSLEEIETGIEDPCTELHSMAREAVAEILASEELMARLSATRSRCSSGIASRAISSSLARISATASRAMECSSVQGSSMPVSISSRLNS